MVNVPPIPMYMLIHNVEVKEAQESSASALHPSKSSKSHKFEHVRVQDKDTSSQTSNGPDNRGAYILFVDATNSINNDDYLIKQGDRVYWNGVNRKVVGNSAIYALDAGHVHHWEVNLE